MGTKVKKVTVDIKAERFLNKVVAYIGKRFSHSGKLLSGFVFADDLSGDVMLYSSKRAGLYPIGSLLNAKITKSQRMDFNAFEQTGDVVSDYLVEQWSAEDAVARRAKTNESARARMVKEHRGAWLTVLEPLRRQYWNASAMERRALKQLLIEWLDTP